MPVDLAFSLSGSAISADYAQALWDGIRTRLPWMDDVAEAGVHRLAGASGDSQTLYLNRRARLVLRLPPERVTQASALAGARFDLGGEVVVGDVHEAKPLAASAVIYAPFVCVGEADELAFVAECRRRLAPQLTTSHLVCGKAQRSAAAVGELRGFSLMLHGLGRDESVALQSQGLGDHRKLGCGLFVPHKNVAAVGDVADAY